MAKNNKKNEKEKKSIDILVDKIITIVGTMIQKANYDVTFESTIVKKLFFVPNVVIDFDFTFIETC